MQLTKLYIGKPLGLRSKKEGLSILVNAVKQFFSLSSEMTVSRMSWQLKVNKLGTRKALWFFGPQ